MISEEYNLLMQNNIRPKCEPVISVSGTDANGKKVNLQWRAKDIKELKYKRGIDPIGRTLPYMELTWTEIYKGKFNAINYPDKYSNVAKYMVVKLSFVQNLAFFNTWKSLCISETTWKSLFDSGKTWKQLKNDAPQQEIILPPLYLEAKPTVENNTIKWVARDFLSFSSKESSLSFDTAPQRSFLNLFDSIFDRLELSYQYTPFSSAYNNTKQFGVPKPQDDFDNTKVIKYKGADKNFLKDYASIASSWWDFRNVDQQNTNNFQEGIRLIWGYNRTIYDVYGNRDYAQNSSYTIPSTVMFSYPKVTLGTDIYEYNYKYYDGETSGTCSIYKESNNCGETFTEDNTANPYGEGEKTSSLRFEKLLLSYFNSDCSVLEFECAANPLITTGDVVTVPTNLYDGYTRIYKDAIVVDFEITYNGVLKEKIIAHEIKE